MGTERIAERLAQVRRRIAAACARSGRDPAQVTLVGASKQQPLSSLAEAYAAGLRVFGENRVQEGLSKAPHLPTDVEWQLLGPLQSNKVRAALSLFRILHAIDREKIARLVAREASAAGVAVAGFLEVNLGGEASKHGFSLAELVALPASLFELPGLSIVGLMAIPPWSEDPEASRPYFRRLRSLRDELAGRLHGHFPGWLSMGMSNDFEVAIEEGATHVRVGTDLFGERPH